MAWQGWDPNRAFFASLYLRLHQQLPSPATAATGLLDVSNSQPSTSISHCTWWAHRVCIMVYDYKKDMTLDQSEGNIEFPFPYLCVYLFVPLVNCHGAVLVILDASRDGWRLLLNNGMRPASTHSSCKLRHPFREQQQYPGSQPAYHILTSGSRHQCGHDVGLLNGHQNREPKWITFRESWCNFPVRTKLFHLFAIEQWHHVHLHQTLITSPCAQNISGTEAPNTTTTRRSSPMQLPL